MNDEMFQDFLDWFRRESTTVTLCVQPEDPQDPMEVLAVGCAPRSGQDQLDALARTVRSEAGCSHWISLGLLRKWYGDAVDRFMNERGLVER